MKNFAGIDLGTTNSAIGSYDGETIRIWKSPEQNDVTPSAIFLDRRGNKYVGKRAYDSAPHSPDNAAMLFKRLMGTSTPIHFPAVRVTKTPEECSAEILKVLFGYLPEEIRNDPDTGTVITVPAAFNQMQKDATLQAAEMAGLGKVALMQEPVAAVMSVMRSRKTDGTFLIYDLGGGTLDIAIAESLGGRVNLLAHGGIAMCGGRDFDRLLIDNVVKPWLFENFDLPVDLTVNPNFKTLLRLAAWAAERAKIELSAGEEAVISLSETEIRVRDRSGAEVYLDIPLDRKTMDRLIADKVDDSIVSAREILGKAGLGPHDVERIVFVGGPTSYKPLRDQVAFALGISGSTEVNPMTAVAEGAALFAESIDWASKNRGRKSTRGQLSVQGRFAVTFNYMSRTPDARAKIAVLVSGEKVPGAEFQIDSIDTGWTSGRIALEHGKTIEVLLAKSGENTFKVFVFDASGSPLALKEDKIVITRTAATVDAIPASHSVGVAVLEKLGGRRVLDWLVRAGDSLPQKGKKTYKAGESLKAGASSSLNISLWEGDIDDPVTDNRYIGTLKISGNDFDDGVIPAGADLLCDYEMLAIRWVNSGLLENGLLSSIPFGSEKYSVLQSGYCHTLVPIAESLSPGSKADALSLAASLRETRKIEPDAPLQDAIFVEQYSRLLPAWSITERVPDDVVLGGWLTGGVAVSVLSFRRLSQLMGWMSTEHLRDIVAAAGFAVPRDLTVGIPGTRSLSSLSAQPASLSEKTDGMESSELDPGEENPKRFVLPGRPQLEEFFNDHVIEIILHAERYRALGIDFPPAIVLHGPPGCGKTYAVEQLVEFMDWPCFSINSNTVGSPYIHETSRKISGVFDKAIDASPSVVVIDEMESYLSDRQISGSTGLHHVEEVAEFLRRIPEAVGKSVLIIGMTNRIDMIDPVLRHVVGGPHMRPRCRWKSPLPRW